MLWVCFGIVRLMRWERWDGKRVLIPFRVTPFHFHIFTCDVMLRKEFILCLTFLFSFSFFLLTTSFVYFVYFFCFAIIYSFSFWIFFDFDILTDILTDYYIYGCISRWVNDVDEGEKRNGISSSRNYKSLKKGYSAPTL